MIERLLSPVMVFEKIMQLVGADLRVCPRAADMRIRGRHTGLPLRWTAWLHLFFRGDANHYVHLLPLGGIQERLLLLV
jgi:hypothetical protein